MADKEQHTSIYKKFFEEFVATVNPDDQLPVRVAGYHLCESEVIGEAIDWSFQYLTSKRCPSSLLVPITRIVLDEVQTACRSNPVDCGYKPENNRFMPFKLMRVVIGKVNEVCQRIHKNGLLHTLPEPTFESPLSVCAVKNTRRRMEDRHVVIEDFNGMFGFKDQGPASYYAIFDGHAGTDAASYSASHLHQFIAESPNYPNNPEMALKDAFSKTDTLFLEKSNVENLRSGTTALCALLRLKEKLLHVAWLGDSQAMLVRKGEVMKIVNPHKPDRKDERLRIEDMGGCVLFWGTWRVNGQLAVSRAIGDLEYKPYVTAEPDLETVQLDGTEDFLLLGCDGLWDFANDAEILQAIYKQISQAPGDIDGVSESLVQLSKKQGSTDNITVIVVFLTEPTQIAERILDDPQFWEKLDRMDTTSSAATNGEDNVAYQKGGVLLDLAEGAPDTTLSFKHNGIGHNASDIFFLERSTNGKTTSGHYDDDDFGPETDVDAVDDILVSPSGTGVKSADTNPFLESDINADLELQRQQTKEFDAVQEPRDETPTPPADKVKNVGSFIPESDNVGADSEDSEDEWNYYRVEPTGAATAQSAETLQTNQTVCEKPVSSSGEDDFDDPNMDARLNPDAAEFVPSPTRMKPSIEDMFLAHSPMKLDELKEVNLVPSEEEFKNEIKQRPGEYNGTDAQVLPDLLKSENSVTSCKIDDAELLEESLEDEGFYKESSGNWNNGAEFVSSIKESSDTVDKSVLQKSETMLESSENASSLLETSFIEKSNASIGNSVFEVLEASQTFSDVQDKNPFDIDTDSLAFQSSSKAEDIVTKADEFDKYSEPLSVIDTTAQPHVSFELQNELAPKMEPMPERVHIENEEGSIFPIGDHVNSSNFDSFGAAPTLEYEASNAPISNFESGFSPFSLPPTVTDTFSASSPNEPSSPTFLVTSETPDILSATQTEEPLENREIQQVSPLEDRNNDNILSEMNAHVDMMNAVVDTNFDGNENLAESVLDTDKSFTAEHEVASFDTLNESKEIETLSPVQPEIESHSPIQLDEPISPSQFDQSLSPTQPGESDQPHPSDALFDLSNLNSTCTFSASSYKPPEEAADIQNVISGPYVDLDPTDPNHPLYKCVYPLPPYFVGQDVESNPYPDEPSIENHSPASIEPEVDTSKDPVSNVVEGLILENEKIPELESFEETGSDNFGFDKSNISSEVPVNTTEIPVMGSIESSHADFVPLKLNDQDILSDKVTESPVHEKVEELGAILERDEKIEDLGAVLEEHVNDVETQPSITRTPPPTPATISEDPFTCNFTSQEENLSKEQPLDFETNKTKTEFVEEKGLDAPTIAVAATATLAAAAAAGVATVESVTSDKQMADQKVPNKKEIKKSTISKEKKPINEKSKPSAAPKVPLSSKTNITAIKQSPKSTTSPTTKSTSSSLKSTPTSPTKPLTTASASLPKKTATSTTRTTKTTTVNATKSPSAPPIARSAVTSTLTTKSASTTAKPRPTSAPATKSVMDKKPTPITNGIGPKPSPTKRAEPTGTKKLVSSSAKVSARPAPLPLNKTSTVTSTTSTTTKVSNNTLQSRTTTIGSARPKTAPTSGTITKTKTTNVTSTISRPKPASAPLKSIDKQIKESANKQISSARNGVTSTKSSSVTNRTVTKVSGTVTKTASTTVTKSSPTGKLGIKKTTTTRTTNPAKTNTNVENNELVTEQIETTVIVTEVKVDPSPFDISQATVAD